MNSESKAFLKNQGPYYLLRSQKPSSDRQPDFIKEDLLHHSLLIPRTPQHSSSSHKNQPCFDIAGSEDQILNRSYAAPGDEKNYPKLSTISKFAQGSGKQEHNQLFVDTKKKSYQDILGKYSVTKNSTTDNQGNHSSHEKLYSVKDPVKMESDRLEDELMLYNNRRSPRANQKSMGGKFGDLSPVTPARGVVNTDSISKTAYGNNEVHTPDKVIEQVAKKDSDFSMNNIEIIEKPHNSNPGTMKGNSRKYQPVNESNFVPSLLKADASRIHGSGLQDSFRSEVVNRSALSRSHKINQTRTGRLVTVKEINHPTLRINIISAKGKLKPTPKIRTGLNSSRFNDRSLLGLGMTHRDSPDKINSDHNLSRSDINRSLIENYKQSGENNKREIQTGLFALLKKPKYSDFLKNPEAFGKKTAQVETLLASRNQASIEEEKRQLQQQINAFNQQAGEYLESARARLELLEEAGANSLKNEGPSKASFERDIQKKASNYVKNSPAQVVDSEKNNTKEPLKLGESLYDKIMKNGKK